MRPPLPCLADPNLTSLTKESRPFLPVFPRDSWQFSKSPFKASERYNRAREKMFHPGLLVFASAFGFPKSQKNRHLFCSLSYFWPTLTLYADTTLKTRGLNFLNLPKSLPRSFKEGLWAVFGGLGACRVGTDPSALSRDGGANKGLLGTFIFSCCRFKPCSFFNFPCFAFCCCFVPFATLRLLNRLNNPMRL